MVSLFCIIGSICASVCLMISEFVNYILMFVMLCIFLHRRMRLTGGNHLKLILKQGRRVLSMVLVLVLMISGAAYSLSTSARAADISCSLYSFIASNCYSDQPVAVKILSSEALNNAGSIEISYPGSDLISVSDGRLMAKGAPVYGADGRIYSVWLPKTYTINGIDGTFHEDPNNPEIAVSDPLNVTGAFRVEVYYEMDSGISTDLLNLPATLAEEAASQITVLNHLISYDKPYMTYMEQMSDNQMKTLSDILDPSSPFAGYVTLNSDPEKNQALKKSFREVIEKMRANCYLEDGTLTFFDLLINYEMKGLIHYYQNSTSYQAEIALFNQYLNEMLGAETRDGVSLTEADKEYAIVQMVSYAERFEYIEGGVTLDFVDLRDNVDAANAMLVVPNAAINRSSNAKLKSLVKILETEAVAEGEAVGEEGVVQWNSLVSGYGSKLTLAKTVSADLNSASDSTGGDGTGDNTDGDNTGSDIGGGNTGGGNTGGDNTGDNAGSSIGGDYYDGASHVSTAGDFKNTLTGADENESIRITSSIVMTEDVSVKTSVKITGANKLNTAGHVLVLTDVKASITADSPLNVASGVDGYVPVKEKNANTYTLAEVSHPKTGGETAGSKTETLNGIRYLFLDLDPIDGMTLDALSGSTSFAELTGYTVKFFIEGNSGSGLVKTADHLLVKAFNADGKCVAQIPYVVIVMGDTNCNGKVNSSDAAVIKNISMGKESSLEVRMAADVNFSGTLEMPKINSSDVSFAMAKWFAWDLNKYVSNLK